MQTSKILQKLAWPTKTNKTKFYFGFFSVNSFHKVNLQEKKIRKCKNSYRSHSFIFILFKKKFSQKCLVQFCFNGVSVHRDGETPVCPIPSEIRKIDGENWVSSRGTLRIYLWRREKSEKYFIPLWKMSILYEVLSKFSSKFSSFFVQKAIFLKNGPAAWHSYS